MRLPLPPPAPQAYWLACSLAAGGLLKWRTVGRREGGHLLRLGEHGWLALAVGFLVACLGCSLPQANAQLQLPAPALPHLLNRTSFPLLPRSPSVQAMP